MTTDSHRSPSISTPLSRRSLIGGAGAGAFAMLMPRTGVAGEVAAVPEYILPELPYAYDALEPFVDAQTMELHHKKHHGGAVNGLSKTLASLADACAKQDFSATGKLNESLAYYGSSHVLHGTFWTNMKKGGGGAPAGELASAIGATFGSVEALRGLFLAASNAAPGAGWGLLGHHRTLDRLVVLTVCDHENSILAGVEPLLVCDVWEHAYYLHYQNRRTEWTQAFFDHLVDWADVARRFDAARGTRR